MTPATSMFSIQPGVNPPRSGRAFSLIEVMVAVTLMSVIVIGLLAMFSQTQKAFRAGITQVDVMEGGRSACELMARELEQVTPTGLANTLNFYAQWNGYALIQSLPGTDQSGQLQWRTNILDDIFFFTRENRNWQGIGYRVESTNMVGTLYRYETNVANLDLSGVYQADQIPGSEFRYRAFSTRRSRIVDGVVHLRVLAYDSFGALLTNSFGGDIGVTNLSQNTRLSPNSGVRLAPDQDLAYHFRDQAVPAYLELEVGILEAKTAERCRNIAGVDANDMNLKQAKFLESKAGNMQIFRQRIPVRNVQPSVYQ